MILIATIVLPLDRGSEALSLKLEGFSNQALSEYEGFQVRTSEALFGSTPDDEAAQSLKRAEFGFSEGKAAFEARKFEDAEQKLRATIKEYGTAVSSMRGCAHLCETLALFAATLQTRGEVEEAKVALLDLLALSRSFEVDHKRFHPKFLALRAQVAASRSAKLRGSLKVKVRPEGTRIFLDDELQGYSPMNFQALPVGKHLLRLERPGYKPLGKMVEVTADEQEQSLELVPSPERRAFDESAHTLAAESLNERGGQTMGSMAKTLKLDRAIFGTIKEVGDATELTMAYFDLKTGRRIDIKRATFQGDDFGQLNHEVARLVNHLVNTGEVASEKVNSTDPLDHKHGTEEWKSEDRGGRNTKREKKTKSGDPLDRVTGTDEW